MQLFDDVFQGDAQHGETADILYLPHPQSFDPDLVWSGKILQWNSMLQANDEIFQGVVAGRAD